MRTNPSLPRDLKSNSKPEIRKWASKALYAVETEDIHKLWSKVMMGDVSGHDMQHLLEGSVTSDSGELADLARSLRCVASNELVSLFPPANIQILSSPSDRNSSYLATLYLERATKLAEEGSLGQEKLSTSRSLTSGCKECTTGVLHPQGNRRRLETSRELLEYVLESAPEGALKDLSDIMVSLKPKDGDHTIGQGGFSNVYKGSIRNQRQTHCHQAPSIK